MTGGDSTLNVPVGTLIRQEVIKNLLNAHKRIADSGRASEVIRITKFILKLSEKRNDVLINFIPEGDKERRDDPVHKLEQLHENTVTLYSEVLQYPSREKDNAVDPE